MSRLLPHIEIELSASDVFRFWSKVARRGPDECWDWTAGTFKGGYGQFWLNGTSVKAHRVAWVLSNGPMPAGVLACHSCDREICCNPAHVFPGTPLDNMRDKISKGRDSSLEKHGRARFTNDQVRQMRAEYAAGGWTYKSLAARHHVHIRTIAFILAGKTWIGVEPIASP